MNIKQKMNKNNLLSSTSKLPDIQTSNEKLINLIQISFNIWNKISDNEKYKNDIFIFFFIACCFILIDVKLNF